MSEGAELRTIGKYRILGPLGRGSMGVVYKAQDPEIGRTVAIKILRAILPGQHGQADEAIKRFMIEARSAGSLRHPNIITIFEINRDGDTPYLVMDYIEGTGFERVIKDQGRIEPELLLYFLNQVASGLDYAHERGVIHRDIKPSNLFIDRSDTAFLLDFGVATLTAETTTGPVVGSPAYMSPEQVANQKLEPSSDLFSFAVVAFEGLTGKRPFPGDDYHAVMRSVLNDAPLSACHLLQDLPPEVDQVFARALSKDRAQRYSSAQSFLLALADALGVRVDELQRQNGRRSGNADSAARELVHVRRRRQSSSRWKRVRNRKFTDVKGDEAAAMIQSGIHAGAEQPGFKPHELVEEQGRQLGETPGQPIYHTQQLVDRAEPSQQFQQESSQQPGGEWGIQPHGTPARTPVTNDLSPYGFPHSDTQAEHGRNTPGTKLFGPPSPEMTPVAARLRHNGSPINIFTGLFMVASICLSLILAYLIFVPARPNSDQIGAVVEDSALPVVERMAPIATDELRVPPVDPVPTDKAVYEMSDRELLGVLVSGGVSAEMVIQALREAQSRRVVGLLEAALVALQHDSALVRIEVTKLIAQMTDKRALGSLLGVLDDYDPAVRNQAAKTIGLLGDRRAIGYLSSRLTRETDEGVKTALRRSIERINGFPQTE
jgi:serine/threonine protein kinase